MTRGPKFRPAPLGRRGYATEEVDAFLEAAERGEMTAEDVHNVAFGRSPFGSRGYDWEEVDAHLNDLERRLRRRSAEPGKR